VWESDREEIVMFNTMEEIEKIVVECGNKVPHDASGGLIMDIPLSFLGEKVRF